MDQDRITHETSKEILGKKHSYAILSGHHLLMMAIELPTALLVAVKI